MAIVGRAGVRVGLEGRALWSIGILVGPDSGFRRSVRGLGDRWGRLGPVEDADSLAALKRALELGINFIDTADVYGAGRSESLVSKVISGRRDKVVVSTKGGLRGHHREPEREPVYTTSRRRSFGRARRASSA
jgi:myo-inositol catabolism protein IolS